MSGHAGYIPDRYQRVINPHQTPREIDLAVKFCQRIAFKILGIVQVNPGEEEGVAVYREVFGLDRPYRKW